MHVKLCEEIMMTVISLYIRMRNYMRTLYICFVFSCKCTHPCNSNILSIYVNTHHQLDLYVSAINPTNRI